METKINIAAILKDKPQGTKLYDWLHNIYVEFDNVETTEIETSIWCTRDKEGYNELFGYSKLGTLRGWLNGLQILLPSKEMRDWRKFAWKKGDVLVSNDSDSHIIFKGFSKNDYTTFEGRHWISVSKKRHISCLEMRNVQDYHLEDNKDAAQTYINTIEKELSGKLNMETLEIEKTQPEFKDGDIVFMKGIKSSYYANCIFILRSEYKDGDERAFYYAFYNTDDKFIIAEYGKTRVHYSLRPATDSEKQQLFDALAKKGKAWDAEKKQIVDLSKKCEFKPMDWCLMRDIRGEECFAWSLCQFAYQLKRGKYEAVGGMRFDECIPYNEETAHLLGTTDEWKGGEG